MTSKNQEHLLYRAGKTGGTPTCLPGRRWEKKQKFRKKYPLLYSIRKSGTAVKRENRSGQKKTAANLYDNNDAGTAEKKKRKPPQSKENS